MAVWLGVVVLATLGAALALDRLTLSMLRPPRRPVGRTPDAVGLAWEPFTIGESTGESRDDQAPALEAWHIRGEAPGGPVLLLAHGWGANSAVVLPLAKAAVPVVSAVVAWDVRAHGRSDGAPVVSLRQFRDDAIRAAHWAAEHLSAGEDRDRAVVMVGHSMGGDAAILAAAAGASLDGIGLVATPCDIYGTVARYLQERGLPGPLILPFTRPFFRLRIGLPGRELDPARALSDVDIPVLVIQPERDTRVPPSEGARLARLSGSEMVLVPGAGHTDVVDHPETARALRDFLLGLTSARPSANQRGGSR